MPVSTQNPFEQERAKQDDARRERKDAEYRADLLDLKRQLNRSRRRRENIAIGVACAFLAATTFACWCVYHVLKAKRLVP